MTTLPLDEAIPRLKENEERLDILVNGDNDAFYTTREGLAVPSIRKLEYDIENRIENLYSGSVVEAQLAANQAGAYADSALQQKVEAEQYAQDAANALSSMNELMDDVLRIDSADQGLSELQKQNGQVNLGLGTAATKEEGYFATAEQGTLAENAIPTSAKGQPNGVPFLDENGLIPSSQIPASGSYLGGWNAATNTPTITSGVGVQGDFFKVTVAGTTNIDGITSWEQSDEVRFNGTAWERIPNNSAVSTVAGRTGDIVLTNVDIGGLGSAATRPHTDFATAAQGAKADAALQVRDDYLDPVTGAPLVPFDNTLGRIAQETFTTGNTGYPGSMGIAWTFPGSTRDRAFDIAKVRGGRTLYMRGYDTTTALPHPWLEITAGLQITTPEKFGCKGDGSTNDSAGWILFCNEVKAGYIGVLGGPGKNYLIDNTAAFTSTNENVRILGMGATITMTSNSRHFRIQVPMLNQSSVSSVQNVSYVFDGETEATPTTRVNFTTPANLANYNIGDLVKIGSDSKIPNNNYNDSDAEREGEFAFVANKDSTGLILSGRLRFPASGNILIARIDQSVKIQIEGVFLDHTGFDPTTSTWANERVEISSAFQPVLTNVVSFKSASQCIKFANCYRPMTYGVSINNARTKASVNAYGYGLMEVSCEYGQHINLRGTNCRHVFTTVAIGTIAGDGELSRRGRNKYSRVINGQAHGCTNSAWDTHADSYQTSFIGCTASWGRVGLDGALVNFQLRGTKDMCIDCVSIGSGTGFFVSQHGSINEVQTGQNDYCRLINCEHVGTLASDATAHAAFRVAGDNAGTVGGTSYPAKPIYYVAIDNCRFHRASSQIPFLRVDGAEVHLTNPKSEGVNGASGTASDFAGMDGAKITIRGGRVDHIGSHTSARMVVFNSEEAGVEWDVEDLEIISEPTILHAIVGLGTVSGSKETTGFIKCNVNVAPTNVSTGTTATDKMWLDINGRHKVNYSNHMTNPTFPTGGTNNPRTIDLNRRGNDPVIYKAKVTAGSTVYATAMNPGAFVGQKVVVMNDPTSVNPLQLSASATLNIGSNKILAPGEAQTLFWTGNDWMRAS